jgi:hypothetical protein
VAKMVRSLTSTKRVIGGNLIQGHGVCYIRTVIPVQRAFIQASALSPGAQYSSWMEADNLHLRDGRVPCKLLEQKHARILGQSVDLDGLSSAPVVDCRGRHVDKVFLQ